MSTRLGLLGVPISGGASVAIPVVVRTPSASPVTTRRVDWSTLVDAFGPVEDQVASYEFSNGRRFFQPEDRE